MAKDDFFDTVKPHTLLKLKVLEKYLDAYAEIMGRVFKSIAFIDAYAGRGKCKDSNNNEYDGSPIIMAKTIKHMLGIENGKCRKAKYYANDLNANNCKILQEYLHPYVDLVSISNKEAKEFISSSLLEICPYYSSVLFFIDPFNYSILKEDIEKIFDACEGYFKNCQSEVILFLPISNIYRFKTRTEYQSIVNFVESYGIDVDKDTDTDKFMEKIRITLTENNKYCASVKLQEGANTYALFFIGKHIYGVDRFMEARDRCLKKDKNRELFILPETPAGQLKLEIEKNTMFNWEIYEWAMKNNTSTARIKEIVEELEIKENLIKEYINCKNNKKTYLLNYENYKDKSKQIKYLFKGL